MMKRISISLLMVAASMAGAQTTPAKPATATATKAATITAKTATHTTATHASATAPKLPPGVPPVKGPVATAFSLRYQDVLVGSGPVAETNKLYKVAYTGWLADGGRKFDASADHPASPVLDKNVQPVKDADGKVKMEAGQPILFPQGMGRVIPGWDQGFEGMRIGGKRRLFVPYQLAYGAKGRPTGDPKNPGIPAKADLIFDVELIDVLDMPAPVGGIFGTNGSHMPMHMPASHPPVGNGVTPAPATPAATPAKPAETAVPAAAPATTPAPAAQPQAK
jgi:peptidylprolyl isomerase